MVSSKPSPLFNSKKQKQKSAGCLFHLLLTHSKKNQRMDFQSLTRRELQTLCKKNKIPANMTNVAMADALKALQNSSTVEGIEELLLLSKKPSESSVDSPAKSQLTSSLSAPRTRTTCRKTVKGESETLPTLTKTTTRLRSTTRLVDAGVSDEAHNHVAQTPSGTGACRKMEIHFKKSEDYDTNKTAKDIDFFSETPAIVPASRKRFPKGDNTTAVRQMRGSRRSARLAEKDKVEDFNNIREKETSETAKAELFSSVCGESWDINVKSPSNDVDTVTETSDIDLKDTSEQGLDINNSEESVSGPKSNRSVNDNSVQIDCQINRDDGDKGANFETGGSMMAVESDGAEGNRSTNGLDDLACKVEDAPENAKNLNTGEEMGSNDVVAGITEDVIDHDEAFSTDNSANFKMNDQELESNKDLKLSHDMSASFKDGKEPNNEKEVEFKDCAAQCLAIEKHTNSEDLDSLNTNGVKRRNAFAVSGECESDLFLVPKSEEQDNGIAPAPESIIEISNSSAEEVFANNVKEKLTAIELNTSAADQEKSFTCSESEMSWVEGAAEPSNAEDSRKNVSGNNADAVTLKQLSNDEVVEGDSVEEDLNTCEALEFQECSSKELGALDVSPSYLAPLVVTDNIAGDVSVQPCLTVADSNETFTDSVFTTGFIPVKESPTPRKISSPLRKPGSKTPTAVKRMMMPQVSDDKENIVDNGGAKQIVAIEKKEMKDTRQENFHKSLDEQSLRMLTKMLKEKLEITKKLNKNDNLTNTKMATATARPALQALSENRLVGGS